jgi:hypothetical protein
MTPQLKERLEREAEAWARPRAEGSGYVQWHGIMETEIETFLAGASAYHAMLLEGAGEFDSNAFDEAFKHESSKHQSLIIEGALWHHHNSAAHIAALKLELEATREAVRRMAEMCRD